MRPVGLCYLRAVPFTLCRPFTAPRRLTLLASSDTPQHGTAASAGRSREVLEGTPRAYSRCESSVKRNRVAIDAVLTREYGDMRCALGNLIFARLVWLFLATVTLVVWLLALPGCGEVHVDPGEPLLRRGETDSQILPPEQLGPDSGPTVMPDAAREISQEDSGGAVNTDGGADLSDSGVRVSNDASDAPPSECPLEPSRSLGSCSGAQTLALCHYILDGHPALQVGCTAEGYLCVKMCP